MFDGKVSVFYSIFQNLSFTWPCMFWYLKYYLWHIYVMNNHPICSVRCWLVFSTYHSIGILDIVCRVVFLFLNDVFVWMALLKIWRPWNRVKHDWYESIVANQWPCVRFYLQPFIFDSIWIERYQFGSRVYH